MQQLRHKFPYKKKKNTRPHAIGHCFCSKFYGVRAGGDFRILHWHLSCSVKFCKVHLLRAQNWGKLSWNSACEELASAEKVRVSTGTLLNSSTLFWFWPKTNRKYLPVPNLGRNRAKSAFLDFYKVGGYSLQLYTGSVYII